MERSPDAREYLVSSELWETSAICSPTIAERVAQIASPFYQVSEGRLHKADGWTVASAEALTAPLPNRQDCLVIPRGEIETIVSIAVEERTLHCVSPTEFEYAAQNVLRYSRALHRLHGVQKGLRFFSGALVEAGGIGIAIIGGSQFGKTSLAIALAREGRATFVSNDDLALMRSESGMVGLGGPRSASIRLDTLNLLYGEPRARSLAANLAHPANLTLHSLKKRGVEPNGTALFYPGELQDRFGINIARKAEVDALLFPHFDNVSNPVLQRLTTKQTVSKLEQFYFNNPVQFADFIPRHLFKCSADRSLSFAEIADTVPAFDFAFAFDKLEVASAGLTQEISANL